MPHHWISNRILAVARFRWEPATVHCRRRLRRLPQLYGSHARDERDMANDRAFALSIAFRPFLRTVLLVPALLTCGCHLWLGGDSGGAVCVGFGCSGASRPRQTLRMAFRDFTRFDHSIKPSVDNFLSRYLATPKDPLLGRWIDDFFGPARRVLGAEFDCDPTVKIAVQPSSSSLTAIAQCSSPLLTFPDPAFARFLPLAQPAKGEVVPSPTMLEWDMTASTKIAAVADETIRYETTVDLYLNRGTPADPYIVHRENDAFRSFADRLHRTLFTAYMELFRDYGLRITRASGR